MYTRYPFHKKNSLKYILNSKFFNIYILNASSEKAFQAFLRKFFLRNTARNFQKFDDGHRRKSLSSLTNCLNYFSITKIQLEKEEKNHPHLMSQNVRVQSISRANNECWLQVTPVYIQLRHSRQNKYSTKSKPYWFKEQNISGITVWWARFK